MLIDIHTHIFPDLMAKRTLSVIQAGIQKKSGYQAIPCTEGTLTSLMKSMDHNQVDFSLVLPIATKASQTRTINRFAYQIRNDRVLSFASLHPEQEDWSQVLDGIWEQGFLGIKLHPEFQQFQIDSKESIRLFQKAEALGLYVIFHAGVDIGIKGHVYSPPEGIGHLLEYVKGDHIIAAHMGGFDLWDQVEEYLVGSPIYLDTAVVSRFIDPQQYKRIIRNHGADHILFGSDSPWEEPSMTLAGLLKLELTEEEMNLICYQNAARILGIKI